MGLRLRSSIDTNLGPTDKLYVRVDNINVNRIYRTVRVGVTYWFDKDTADSSRERNSRLSKGMVSNKIIIYEDPRKEGKEINLPVHFEFKMESPRKVTIPIYEETPVEVEKPYVGFDDNGRRVILYRTETIVEKKKIGEREDYSQVLDLDLETSLVSWCYGQIKAELGQKIPVELLENC